MFSYAWREFVASCLVAPHLVSSRSKFAANEYKVSLFQEFYIWCEMYVLFIQSIMIPCLSTVPLFHHLTSIFFTCYMYYHILGYIFRDLSTLICIKIYEIKVSFFLINY